MRRASPQAIPRTVLPDAMSYEQANRALRVYTQLGDGAFVLTSVDGEEAVSRPFRLTLTLEAGPGEVDAAALLGTPARVEIAAAPGEFRVLHGRVSRFRHVGAGTVLHRYQMELVPWLWMLSLSTDCRIFQQMSVPEIVTQVFRDLGFTDHRSRLMRAYPKREFCVQYRESHLDFVSRLLEEEGIFYYFQHEAERHTLVLGDGPPSVRPCPGLPALRPAPGPGAWVDSLHALYTAFEVERVLRPATVTLADYNYLTPSVSLEASLSTDEGRGELFDYPGKYEAADDGTRYARLRLEGADAERERAEGASQAPGLRSGTTVQILGAAEDRDWFVLTVGHRARQGSAVAGDAGAFGYENTFTAVPAPTPWRPPRATPCPRVRGTQSALVVGLAGEEIYTDAQGRVKLHFYWDRQGKRDERSSCWVRCSTAWAGKGWGQFSVPRIGQEVLVDFLEGDPDRPVVVGRVYNAEQPPPCDPGGTGGVVSGMRSKTHKGTGYNAIEVNDTAGAELFSAHAQYDMDTVVEHDARVSVGNNRTERVGADETISVGKDRKEDVAKNETVSVGEDQSLSVGKSQSITVGKDQTLDVTERRTKSIGKDEAITVGGKRTTQVAADDVVEVGKKLLVSAADEIVLQTGDASIVMKKDGTITITGQNVKVVGSGKVTVKADSDVVIKGSKVTAN